VPIPSLAPLKTILLNAEGKGVSPGCRASPKEDSKQGGKGVCGHKGKGGEMDYLCRKEICSTEVSKKARERREVVQGSL